MSNVERGSGTVLAIMLIAGIFAAGFLLTALAVTQQTRWQVQTAADLGAIAGASAWRTGFNPCDTAREVVNRNASELINCELRPFGTVKITASLQLNLLGGHRITAYAVAAPRGP